MEGHLKLRFYTKYSLKLFRKRIKPSLYLSSILIKGILEGFNSVFQMKKIYFLLFVVLLIVLQVDICVNITKEQSAFCTILFKIFNFSNIFLFHSNISKITKEAFNASFLWYPRSTFIKWLQCYVIFLIRGVFCSLVNIDLQLDINIENALGKNNYKRIFNFSNLSNLAIWHIYDTELNKKVSNTVKP